MSINQMKDRIAEKLKKAKETGQITTEKVSEIVKDAVSSAIAETKGGIEELRPVVKDAVAAAVEGLKDAGADAKENVEGVIQGAISGARSRWDQAIEATREELQKLETCFEAQQSISTICVKEGLKGAKEAGASLPEDVRGWVESAVIDIKLKNTEILGLTKQTVKEAVKQAIEYGKDVKKTVGKIAGDATEKALKEGHLTADRVKRISEKVISGAVEAAEEAGKEVKDVASAVFEGTQKGIASAVDSIEHRMKEFLHKDLSRTKGDLEAIEGLFLKTTRKVAGSSGEIAKGVLNDLVDQAKKSTSLLREKTRHAGEPAAERLRQAGKDAAKAAAKAAGKAADVMGKETKELGKRSLDVARGAISGMWKGAKDALKKEKEE